MDNPKTLTTICTQDKDRTRTTQKTKIRHNTEK